MNNDWGEGSLLQPEPIDRATRPRRSRIHYGWLLLAAAMIIAALPAWVAYSFVLLLRPLQVEFAWDAFQIGIVLATGALANVLASPLLGHFADRFNARRVVVTSLAALGLATAALGFVSNFWHLIVLHGIVMSVAMGGASFTVLGSLVARWFLKRRLLALGLLMFGAEVGGLFGILIGFPTEFVLSMYGWRDAFKAFGAIVLVLALPLGWKCLRNWPSDRRLKPDGDPESPEEAGRRGGAPIAQQGLYDVAGWRQAFRSPPFWVLLLTAAITGASDSFVSSSYALFATYYLLLDLELVAIFNSVIHVLGPIGGLGVAVVADRFARKKVLGALLIVQGIAILVLLAGLSGFSLLSLALFAVLTGLSSTAWLLIALALVADVYGLRALATLWGLVFLFKGIGAIFGGPLGLFSAEITGHYFLPYAACALMLVLTAIAVFRINERKYSARYQAAIGVDAAGN